MNILSEGKAFSTGTHPRRHWLVLGRLIWVGLAAGYLVIWLASLNGFITRVSTLNIEPYRLGDRVIFDNNMAWQRALQRGLSLEGTAYYDIALELFQILFYYFVAALILWRVSGGFGWFTAFILMLMATTNMQMAINVGRPFPAAAVLIELPGYFIWPFWTIWVYLFPNGHSVHPRTVLPVGVTFAAFMALQAASFLSVFGLLPARIDASVASLAPLGVVPLFGLILYSQIYRYLRISSLLERQQTKWFLFAIMLFLIVLVPFPIIPGFYQLAYVQDLISVLFLVFPIAIAVAIFRYRLWDIDLLIRRTLVYSALTIILAVAYFGGVIVLQNLFQAITGRGESPLATVISTLGIAALFNPLRYRIQDFIDRSFYRRKYDAERVITQFAALARDEVDIGNLSAALVHVAQSTLQPELISLMVLSTRKQKD